MRAAGRRRRGDLELCEASRTHRVGQSFDDYAGWLVWRAMVRAVEAHGRHEAAARAALASMIAYGVNYDADELGKIPWSDADELRKRVRGFSTGMAQAAATAAINALDRCRSPEDLLAEQQDEAVAKEILSDTFRFLPPPERQALMLICVEEMTRDEAGKIAKASGKTMARRVEKGLATLRREFERAGIKRKGK